MTITCNFPPEDEELVVLDEDDVIFLKFVIRIKMIISRHYLSQMKYFDGVIISFSVIFLTK